MREGPGSSGISARKYPDKMQLTGQKSSTLKLQGTGLSRWLSSSKLLLTFQRTGVQFPWLSLSLGGSQPVTAAPGNSTPSLNTNLHILSDTYMHKSRQNKKNLEDSLYLQGVKAGRASHDTSITGAERNERSRLAISQTFSRPCEPQASLFLRTPQARDPAFNICRTVGALQSQTRSLSKIEY